MLLWPATRIPIIFGRPISSINRRLLISATGRAAPAHSAKTTDNIEFSRTLHHRCGLESIWYQYGTPARGDMIEGRPIRLLQNHLSRGEQAGDFLIK